MESLKELYRSHQGLLSDKWDLYLREYDRLFSPYRGEAVRLLEIGIQNGGSLEIWSQYFPKGERFVGCDFDPDCSKLRYADPRISVVVGDANTDHTQAEVISKSDSFDLVIDDGSHTSGDIVKSFARYFPYVKDGGAFVAEDLHCSYWQSYEGGLYYPYSSIAFFKRLADIVNHEHWGIGRHRRHTLRGIAKHHAVDLSEDLLSEVHSIEFINSMCIVRKAKSALNGLGSRVFAGQKELVTTSLALQVGCAPVSADETRNPWSALDEPPDEVFDRLRAELSDLKNLLAERDAQIAGLMQSVSERDERIAQILTSKSWILTKPFRLLRRKLSDIFA